MGNKDENTNLIGRKGSKMTMQSNVKTLALKVYDEQDFEKLKSLLKCHKVCSKTFAVKSNTVRLKRDKDKIQKRFLSGK